MRWPTTWRMIVPVAVVSGMLLVVGVTAAWYVHRLNQEVSQRLADHVAAVLASERLVLELRDVRLDLERFVDTSDPARFDMTVAARREIERSLRDVEKSMPKQKASELREQTCQSVRSFLGELDALASQSNDDMRSKDARKLVRRLNRNVLVPAEQLLDEYEQAAAASSQRNETMASRVGLALLLLGLCGAVAGLLAGYGIARGVHRSIVQLSFPVHDMAGQLNKVVGPITVASDGDLNDLENSLQELAEKTSVAVKQIQTTQQQQLRSEQLAAIGQLAAGLAHELRNPLMSIKLIVQAATERDSSETFSRRDLQVLEDEITRLERMLQSFLDFARPPRLQKQRLDIRSVIASVIEVVQPRASQQDVRLHQDSPEHDSMVDGDESQLRQVVLNLVLNALDALPSGGNIWLAAAQVSNLSSASPATSDSADGDGQITNLPYVSISVADDGPGLPSDVANRIFEPFVSTKETGTGLGLSICRQVIELHGGKIIARNRTDGGAELTISLPIEKADSSSRATAVSAV